MQRFCFALDLKDDPELIREYEHYHQTGNDWPAVTKNDVAAGILSLQLYRTGNRLFMIMDTDDAFTFEKKAALDVANPKVQEWEKLMGNYQVPLPWAKAGEKWVLMDKIFQSREPRV